MRINAGRVADAASIHEGPNFTGEVWVDPVLDDTEDVMGYNVFFTPSARTHWHRHTEGQVLVVTAGSGRVATREGGVRRVRPGDVIWTAPGEEHWHGADAGSYLLHTAVSLGRAEWLEPVSDADYDAFEREGDVA